MKQYLITSCTGVPDWSAVPQLSVDLPLWIPDCGIRAMGQFCHDDRFLHVRLRAAERLIRSEYTAPLSPVYRDSCLEFFFMPEGEDRYLNFEINPNGCLYIGFGRGRDNRMALYPDGLAEQFALHAARKPDGWEVTYRIPLSFLRLFWPGFSFSDALRANVYKCGDWTEQPHFLVWNPVVSEKPDFHRPQDFGIMRFT